MDLNLPGADFGIKNTKESCQEDEKEPSPSIALKILSSTGRYS